MLYIMKEFLREIDFPKHQLIINKQNKILKFIFENMDISIVLNGKEYSQLHGIGILARIIGENYIIMDLTDGHEVSNLEADDKHLFKEVWDLFVDFMMSSGDNSFTKFFPY